MDGRNREPIVKENNENDYHDSSEAESFEGKGLFVMRAGDKAQSYGMGGIGLEMS